MALVDRINSGLAELRHRDQSLSINDWADYFTFGGNTYPLVQTTMGTVDREQVGFTSVAGFKGSGPIFSLVLARLQVFSQVRFQWTRFAGSQPTELFGTPELGVLERPWHGGTTSDLLARMEVYASVAGCAYVTRPRADRLSLLRPDRVIIIMGSETDAEDPSEAPDAEIIGFVHETSRGKMTFFDPDQVAYYAPVPDPDYRFLGMSWITPVIRDLQADSLATEHKARFFCNAATPNLAIKFDASIAIEKVKQFKELLESEHKGAFNAWKTLYLGGGADPVTVGNSFKDMDYAVIQGRAESRLASAAGVPPSWVGFAEGLSGSSLNAGNFNAGRRRFSDGTMIHLWTNAATSLEVLLTRPSGASLWYDPRVPFMREDAGDLAAIQQNQAQTIVALVRDGFTPESAVAAVTKNDFSLLVHSGKVSVQLQEPGTNPGSGEQVPKVSAPDGARTFYPRALPLVDEWDDDPIRELDDETLVVLTAMAELEEEAGLQSSRAYNPALHLRWPKGHPKAGQFRPMIDQLKAAIQHFDPAKDKHPFVLFKRPQLLKAAKARGIAVKRGESDDSIAAKLLADLTGKPATPKPTPAPSAAPAQKPATALSGPTPWKASLTTKPGANWPTGDKTTEVHLGSDQLGVVVHSSKTHGYFPFSSSASKRTPLGNMVRVQPGAGSGYQSEQSAVDAIVRAHTPSKVSGPGLAGLKLAELRIESQVGGWNGKTRAKTSHEIHESGTPIGTVHDWGYGWSADDPSGNSVQGPSGAVMKTKSEAIQALAAAMPNPPSSAAKAAPASPVHTPAQQASKNGPEIQAALDILFGKDPKGHTMARQLTVYGALRRNQFDQLGPREQSTVLGDLSFIATTSKGKSAADAANLVHRFTPAGTTTGMVHKQAVHLPPGVAAAQTRVTDPNGTPGLLKVRAPKDRGTSGDGWIRLPNGGTGPWGQYGAAGVMLRHVDPGDGKERFLMVQRGPGISDPGKWQFPGGAIDSKESPHEGAARETVEELGFKAKDMLDARVHGTHEVSIPGSTWKYTSIAATVDKQLKPDLSTHHAQMETADAKWMTRDEIKALDSKGKLLKPLAGRQLETNVMTLFPSKAAPLAAGTPGKRPPRLTGTPTVSAPAAVTHKPSSGTDLFPDKASKDALRQQIKADRKKFAGKSADDRLAAIGAMQGFDATPTVVDKAEMDRLLKTGDYIEAWRGVQGAGASWRGPGRGGAVSKSKTAADINEEMRTGTAYYGNGIFGNGYYFATDKGIANGYTDHTKGSLVRVLIPKKAKMMQYRDALSGSRAASSSTSKAKGSYEDGTLYNEGRYAAARGFDMIEIAHGTSGAGHVTKPGKPAFNILNRSVLIVEEA